MKGLSRAGLRQHRRVFGEPRRFDGKGCSRPTLQAQVYGHAPASGGPESVSGL